MKQNKAYVQFSKRMVVLVTVAVTVIVAASVLGMIYDSAYTELPKVLDHYLGYASVVFVAYSGNSALEKWLVKRNATTTTSDTTQSDTSEVG